MSKSMYSCPSTSQIRDPRDSFMNVGYGSYTWKELATPMGIDSLARSSRARDCAVRPW